MNARLPRLVSTTLVACALTLVVVADRPAQAAPTPRRLALLFAQNDGGEGRAPLAWAVRDAERLGDLLVALGGVAPEDRILVSPASRDAMVATLKLADLIARTSRAADRPVEVIVYYSGHASAAGLHLGRELLPFSELRRLVLAIDAALTVTIVDACASGGVLRDKGGVSSEPFLGDVPPLTGRVFLTSAAQDELAQESERLQSSWFTHDLLTALTGAADFDQDRAVTLGEAYRYTHAATAARSREQRRTQTPAWELSLKGTGDLVLTRLRGPRATLVLSEPIMGRVTLFGPGERIVHELDKAPGSPLSLSLPPGPYRLQVLSPDRRLLRETRLELAAASTIISKIEHLEIRDFDTSTRPRGEPDTPARLALLPGLALGGPPSDAIVHGVGLALFGDEVAELRGAQLAGVFTAADLLVGAQLAPVNVASQVTGTQLGLVNVATSVTGAQIGLINVASRVTGAQLGFFSWVDDGLHHLELGATTRHLLSVGWRIGNPHLHTALTFDALPPSDDPDHACALTFAVGARVHLAPLDLDLDVGPTLFARACRPETLGDKTALTLRATLALPLARAFTLTLGGRVELADDGVEPVGTLGLRLFR